MTIELVQAIGEHIVVLMRVAVGVVTYLWCIK
jgi:hypothetical protein